MRNIAMQREIMETYKNRFVQDSVSGMFRNTGSECVVFCKKVAPNVFNIRDGFAVVSGTEGCYDDGVCMISNSTKVVFVFDRPQEER